jgi:hypothetical protein
MTPDNTDTLRDALRWLEESTEAADARLCDPAPGSDDWGSEDAEYERHQEWLRRESYPSGFGFGRRTLL